MSAAMVLTSCAAPRSCAGGILSDTARRGSVDLPSSRTIRRLRRVEVDFDRVFPGGQSRSAAHTADRLTLNVFPDVCLIVDRERAIDLGQGKVQWDGRVQGPSSGRATLVIDDRLMVGAIRLDREIFEIRYLGDGVHAVMDIDQSAFPRD
jgi:hypothetical protein